MNRNWHGRAGRGLPILSAAMLSAVGLLWDAAVSGAAAQTYPGTSNQVIVNYDALNALPGQAAPYGTQAAPAPPQPQFAPGYAQPPGAYATAMPYPPYPYAPYYGAVRPGFPYPVPLAPGLASPPRGMPSSGLTILGPDGRPITPIKLTNPGTGSQMAAVTPPGEPSDVPADVPMLEPTPPAPAPGENAGQVPAVPEVETPQPPAEAAMPAAGAEQPAEQLPVEQQAAEQPAEEQPVEQQAAQEPPAPEQPVAEQSAQSEAAEAAEEQPTEAAAAETPPEPDNTQPAPPIPQGGIRIVFPTELNDVPSEANAALDDLAAQMVADESMRIHIKCYSSGTEDTESKARRKSLQRCINIRQYLFKRDVRTTRIDVRALGLKSEGQPADRVDIVPANS